MSRPLRRVVLVDDHDLFRAGVRAGLEKTVEVVGEAGTVAEAVPLIKELDPDAVAADRRGLAESIRGRMERVGGSARIVSAPDEGTDVEVELRYGRRLDGAQQAAEGPARPAPERK